MRPGSRLHWTLLCLRTGSCRPGEIGQRMRAVEAGTKMRVDPGIVDFGKRGRLPAWIAVLVEEQGAHTLGELVVDAAADRCLVLEPENVGERSVPCRGQQGVGQSRRSRRATPGRFARLREPA